MRVTSFISLAGVKWGLVLVCLAATPGGVCGVEPDEDLAQRGAGPGVAATPAEDETVIAPPKLPDPKGAKKLPKPDEVWVDAKNKQVLVDGYVSLREGYLEMFACLVGTKEHESIVAVRSRAHPIHAALLAIGARSGTPVQYVPEFRPPTGTEIEVEVRWLDKDSKWKSARAQEWILNTETKKPMDQPWVFAGSGFWQDPDTGKNIYMAESGDLICVSNFTTAMLDVPIQSSQANDGLIFEANSDEVPELGTPVRLVLTPKLKKADAGEATDAKEAAEASGDN
jgi:hypothetical protein